MSIVVSILIGLSTPAAMTIGYFMGLSDGKSDGYWEGWDAAEALHHGPDGGDRS